MAAARRLESAAASAKTPIQSAMAACAFSSSASKMKPQGSFFRKRLHDHVNRRGHSAKARDDFGIGRKSRPKIFALQRAEVQQVLQLRYRLGKTALVNAGGCRRLFKKKSRARHETFAQLLECQTHLFQKFDACVPWPEETRHQDRGDHADANFNNSPKRWLPGKGGVVHPVAGYDHGCERAEEECVRVFGITEHGGSETDHRTHQQQVEDRLLLKPCGEQVSDDSSGNGADDAHDRFFCDRPYELRKHHDEHRGESPGRLGQPDDQRQENRKHPCNPKLDPVTNGQVPKDFFGSFSPPAPSSCRAPLGNAECRRHQKRSSPCGGLSFKLCDKEIFPTLHRAICKQSVRKFRPADDRPRLLRAPKKWKNHPWNGLLHSPANC